MGLSHQHELHKRRFGRNLGLGLVLAGFVALVFGMTVCKSYQRRFCCTHNRRGQATDVDG